MPRKTVDDRLEVLADLDKCPKSPKLSALFEDNFQKNLEKSGKIWLEVSTPSVSTALPDLPPPLWRSGRLQAAYPYETMKKGQTPLNAILVRLVKGFICMRSGTV